jgi:uncharacterized protein YbjT (DUF2867 family)
MNTPDQHRILVLGATGKVGSRLAARLHDLGHDVRPASRGSDPSFDWNDPSTWHDTVKGVDVVFVSYYPDLGFPGAAKIISAFTRCALDAGVRRFVLLSGRGEPEAARSERAMCELAPNWTVLRSSWFAQNFSEHFLLGPVLDGVIALPAGDVVEPFVDVDDVADVAVAALLQPGHDHVVYELTGPQLLSFGDVAGLLTVATGRSISYVPVTAAEYITGAVAAGVPAEEAPALAELFSVVLDGRNAHVTDDVQRVLGRPARTFASYAAAAAASGMWNNRPVVGGR